MFFVNPANQIPDISKSFIALKKNHIKIQECHKEVLLIVIRDSEGVIPQVDIFMIGICCRIVSSVVSLLRNLISPGGINNTHPIFIYSESC